ncbi:unnamed protein product [Darwinula stevensoni]|uniref:C3H1-type domain-containing protein n=1 Tax=Darwinula stevensoni TaxID=69355 RepID=A0A7R9AG52_9CRUS|nr:unnamed protein product [Darwinula stevensoni]CAG0903952.1 unnamed protein product [Darwinula stevensoni]
MEPDVAGPDLCREYNVGQVCSRGDECLKLHICAGYIAGTCEECKLNHDVFDQQCKKLLKQANVHLNRSRKELRTFFMKKCDVDLKEILRQKNEVDIRPQIMGMKNTPQHQTLPIDFREKEIEAYHIGALVRNFYDSGVENRNESNAFQDSGITAVICFFYRGTNGRQSILDGLRSPLPLNRQPFVVAPSPYESPEQVQMLFECQSIFLYYKRAQGIPTLKYVAAETVGMEGLCEIVLSEAGGATHRVFIPPGEPFNVRVQVSPNGGDCEVHWNWPVVGGNYVNGNPTSASVQQVSLADLGQDRGGLEYATSDGQDARKLVAGRIGPLRRPAEYLKQKATLIRHGLYQVPIEDIMRDPDKRRAKCRLSFDSTHEVMEERVIILLGASGAGKSTLVNAFVNNFYGVQWEDPFRLVLIPDTESGKPKANSQTSWITAYTLPWQEGCRAPYNLTIVDTPGFGDTSGLNGNCILRQLHGFFSKSKDKGLNHLDGVGFVLPASNARLTPTEKYIFHSFVSVFGKDIVNNIYLMITFADWEIPPVLAGFKEGNIPFVEFFRFNNFALFVSNEVEQSEDYRFDAMYWHLGSKSLSDFFAKFQESKPVSFQMRKNVLKERWAF